jgi:uncharacterized paraquat-inducible protein A
MSMAKSGRWSRKYDKCLECGTTERPHYAKGLCARCYMRLYKRRQRQAQRERMRHQAAG